MPKSKEPDKNVQYHNLISITPDSPDSIVRTRKAFESMRNEKEELKLSIFVYYMVIYVGNLKGSM